MGKFKHFKDIDVRIITEEVTYLMNGGYRAKDKTQIMDGLNVALEGSPLEDWKRWAGMKLKFVIDELHYLGTP